MNTISRPARIAAVLLVSLVSLGDGRAARRRRSDPGHAHAEARTRSYTGAAGIQAHRFQKHYGSKVMIGVDSMQDFKSLRVEYGFDLGTAKEIPALHAVLVRATPPQLHALLARAPARFAHPLRLGGSTTKRQTQSMPNDPYLSTIDGTTQLPYEWAFLSTHVDRALNIARATRTSSSASSTPGSRTCPTSPARSTASGRSTGRDDVQDFDRQRRVRPRHRGRLADRRERRRRDRHGGLRRRHPRIGIHAGDDGIFNDTQVAVALTKLVSLGVRIVNMSLGGRTPSEPILVDAIHNAAAQGVLLIASAGNDGGYVGWPAADLQPSGGGRSYGLAVGAIDGTGHRASFSDYGKHLSLVAPGTYGGTNAGVLVALPPASRFDDESSQLAAAPEARTTHTSRARRSRRPRSRESPH